MNINWLDGKDAANHYIMEIHFVNGNKGFLKSLSFDVINNYYLIFKSNPDCQSFTIHQPDSIYSKVA